MMVFPVQAYVLVAADEQSKCKKKKKVPDRVNFCLKKPTLTPTFFFFSMPSIQREMTRSFSESCTYIKDASDSPPAVAMEVAEM